MPEIPPPNRLILLFSLMLIVLSFNEAPAGKYTCDGLPAITVFAKDPHTANTICDYAEKSLSILSRFGLIPLHQIIIEIVEEEIQNLGCTAYGAYDSRTDRITLMSYQSILRNQDHPQMYGEFFDRVFYGSVIAHEITHAVFHQYSPHISPGIVQQEYLAHAIQLAVLPEDRRTGIVARMEVTPWESGDIISDTYLGLDPEHFAVKSYSHLVTCDDPQAFIGILLNSKWFSINVP
ncbi:DUF6639 family protein [Desulfopila inferna]|uniref:DUF6639 family protein n=1 Tax=Desulfopila inferna TaxID=468528 RepID=UPI0019643F29|nr:DUF6639 family protein [Desulfopila inferna]MBM9603852.1 hypothetical protein [Desulfopila inferna]